MRTTIDDLISRRSIRKYNPQQITQQELDTVLMAGTYAPTALNLQSPLIVAVQDKQTRDLISRLNGSVFPLERGGDPFYGAPTVIVVFADGEFKNGVKDASLVMGNLLNAAHAIGLGSCWIDRAYEVFQTEEGKALKKKWGVPEKYIGVGNCILGYADQEVVTQPRKEGYIIKVC